MLALSLFYAFIARTTTLSLFDDINKSVFFVLSLLIGYALFAISSIFLMIHVTQKRFEDAFTLKLVLTSLGVTFLLLGAGAVFITTPTLVDIITAAFTLVSLLMLFLTVVFLIKSPTIEYEVFTPKHKPTAIDEVESLYQRGIITEAEYNSRKAKQ